MSIKIALLGFGTVGKGTYRALELNKEEIAKRTGVEIEIAKILEKNQTAIESGPAPKDSFTQNYDDILEDKEIQIVIEMMGGLEPATSFMEKALNKGKHVVTPNKAAVAKNYEKLHRAASKNNVSIRYEASVGGAIPVIATINDSLVANKITKIEGIVNGTTNYILTKMEEEGQSYEEALLGAQRNGFAEADPTADVEGIDAANKICILMAEAFGVVKDPETIEREGITNITKDDIEKAKKSGQTIKLLASAFIDSPGNVKASVKPTLIDKSSMLANVKNEFNAILLSCSMANDIFLYGKGAGMDPTGSAVAADIIAIAKDIE